jgi:uncharacterized protein YydD (DUF2326 family)
MLAITQSVINHTYSTDNDYLSPVQQEHCILNTSNSYFKARLCFIATYHGILFNTYYSNDDTILFELSRSIPDHSKVMSLYLRVHIRLRYSL